MGAGESGVTNDRVRSVFVAVDAFDRFDYGLSHPLKMYRLQLTSELIFSLNLFKTTHSTIVPARMATEAEVLTFHDSDYLDVLKSADNGNVSPDLFRSGLGTADCPAFEGCCEGSLLACGASLAAADELIGGNAEVAFNISGGLHHAHQSRASGFCYVNDPVVAINKLLGHFERVAYVDIDAHAGDGVMEAFYDTNRVLTISTHENGRFLFPGTCFEDEVGEGNGVGFAVNIPFMPKSGDDAFIKGFDEIVVPLLHAYAPDVLVTQLGVDTLSSDPITDWELTTRSLLHALAAFRTIKVPWLALGGGGYDVANVCRGWTLAWAAMNGVEVSDDVPKVWETAAAQYGVQVAQLRDSKPSSSQRSVLNDLDRVNSSLKETVFPVHGLPSTL